MKRLSYLTIVLLILINGCKKEVSLSQSAFEPAATEIDLGILSSGTYDLKIKTGQNTSTVKLTVGPDIYTIRFDRQNQFHVIYSKLNRLPANTIWETISYRSDTSSALSELSLIHFNLLANLSTQIRQ